MPGLKPVNNKNLSMKSSAHEIKRIDLIIALFCFVAGLAFYISTLAPGLLYGDSAEFQTLAYTLGMTHPTGYPIYLLVAKAFVSLVPVGEIAYRVNLLSAVCAALTLALTYLVGYLLTGRRLAALVGVIVLATIDIFWIHSILAELYTPAAALVAVELLLLILWQQKRNARHLFVAGILGGLSLGVHNIVSLMVPAVLVYLVVSRPSWSDWRFAISGALVGLILAFGAFLILDTYDAPSSYYNSVARPSLSVWDMKTKDFDSPIERLGFLYVARQFRGFMFSQPLDQAWEKFTGYFEGMHWLEILLLGLGLVTLFIRRPQNALLISLSWLAMVSFIVNYDVGDFFVFFIPTYIPLVLIGIVGLATLADSATWVVEHTPLKDQAYLMGSLVSVLIAIPLLVPDIPQWIESARLGYPLPIEEMGDYPYPYYDPMLVHHHALVVVDQLEDNAIVFTGWDTLYAYYFVAHVEQGRTGIAFHETYPQDGVEELADSALDYIDTNIDSRPIYITGEQGAFRPYYLISKINSRIPLLSLSQKP